MTRSDTVARSLHDLGLAAWFGGSVMGAVGLNGAAARLPDRRQRLQAASRGWARWAPVNGAAIAAHVTGAVLLLEANKGRLAAQAGVGRLSAVKAGLTVAALGTTAVSAAYGQKTARAGEVEVEGATEPAESTPAELARAQARLRLLQWATPLLTGAIVVLNAQLGEQQRSAQVAQGIFSRFSRK